MKKLLVFLAIVAFMNNGNAQDTRNLNAYKYVYIPTLTYQNGSIDIYGISSEVRTHFEDKGFIIITESEVNGPEYASFKSNNCTALRCQIEHPAPRDWNNKVTISLYNCFNKLICKLSGSGSMGIDHAGDYRIAVKKAFKNIRYNNYDPKLTPEIIYPTVEQTGETKETLQSYFEGNTLSSLEGIYKSYQSKNLGYYEIGIKQIGNVFKAIVIDSEYNHWKEGEVKAIFEQSSLKDLFSAKWRGGGKNEIETFATIESSVLLSIKLNENGVEDSEIKFIKMYPSSDPIASNIESNETSTGSGFVVTKNGVIATNAHVISNANRIELDFLTEAGVITFDATVLLQDKVNDVALLQVESEDFNGFSDIPYTIQGETEIGEDVFTIGFPMSFVMGDNFKVTNGIVSSNSGINDDIRYMQITTPIQPGNSGGPLFDNNGNVVGLTTAKLNDDAVGTKIENVNYAIKANYLLNLYNMLPKSESLSIKNLGKGKNLKDQIKILRGYVCLVKVYI